MTRSNKTTISEAAQRSWDVIVIGAGPAGAMAAYELARQSLCVLLIDKSDFPRPKVCGCCLNDQTLSLLRSGGLSHVVQERRAVPLTQIVLAASKHRAIIPLPGGLALSREALDMGLIKCAVEKGVTFLANTRALLNGTTPAGRQVVLRSNGLEVEANAAVVLLADGLGGMMTRAPKSKVTMQVAAFGRARLLPSRIPTVGGSAGASPSPINPSPHAIEPSRIGAAIIVDHGPAFYQSGTIYMACGPGGYVGLVRLEDGRLNMAAAFDRQALRMAGNGSRLAQRILDDAGLPLVPEVLQMPWKGTPPLTHHVRRLAGERVFVLGDAASFVEPFTGEGIAWALRSGIAVAPLAGRAVERWESRLEKEWAEIYRQQVERRQLLCRLTAATLRHPSWTTLAIRLLAFFPFLTDSVYRRLNARHGFRKEKSL